MAVRPAPVRVPGQRSLAPSVTLVTSVSNDGYVSQYVTESRHKLTCVNYCEINIYSRDIEKDPGRGGEVDLLKKIMQTGEKMSET